MAARLSEDGMERLLRDRGYDLYRGDDTIDSTLTLEYAIAEGYEPVEVDGVYYFYKNN